MGGGYIRGMGFKDFLKAAALWAWQAPQNALGLAVTGLALLAGGKTMAWGWDARVTMAPWRGSVSLGRYVVMSRAAALGGRAEFTLLHEMGHQRQSMLLGPLYLPAVGAPSVAWASLRRLGLFKARDYYSFYTERWANRLAGLE